MRLAKLFLVVVLLAPVGCGGSDTTKTAGKKEPPLVAEGPVKGRMTIAQWPLYIDPGKKGTIAEFERDTGVKVKYSEEINDNVEFFGKIRPFLARGESGGRSLITVSDWLAARMYDLGYLQRLDYKRLPNVEANLIPNLAHPAADPERKFTVPWQSGMTGLIVRTDLAPEIDEIKDLYDPKYKGKVSMLTELRDTVPMTLKSMGIDPDKATTEQWMSAVDKPPTLGRSGASPATTTSRTCRRATWLRRSAGRATPSSCRRTTRTSSS
jgi:spermidine/putrescine transport system substrate-binding protein